MMKLPLAPPFFSHPGLFKARSTSLLLFYFVSSRICTGTLEKKANTVSVMGMNLHILVPNKKGGSGEG